MRLDLNPQYTLDAQGWLQGEGSRIDSQNFDERPQSCEIEAVIIHSISLPEGDYRKDNVDRLFTNCMDYSRDQSFEDLKGVEVSSHFLIRRGGNLVQFVSTEKRAWHAGESVCLGKTRANDFTIGIELEGCDYESFTLAQYQKLLSLSKVIRKRYPRIRKDAFFAHSEIAPERKTDPGPHFRWELLMKGLN